MDDMNDRDLEALLRRHRPVAPPPGLRERVLFASDGRGAWTWLAVAAALLAVVIGAHGAIGAEMSAVAPALAAGSDVAEQNALLDLVSDEAAARQLLALMLIERQTRDTSPAQLLPPGDRGESR
jgi:hypothetical protein